MIANFVNAESAQVRRTSQIKSLKELRQNSNNTAREARVLRDLHADNKPMNHAIPVNLSIQSSLRLSIRNAA